MRIARPPITYYQNAKNATLFRFLTSEGADYDLSVYDDVKVVLMRGFNTKEELIVIDPTVSGNTVSWEFSSAQMAEIFVRKGYVFELRFYSGSDYVVLVAPKVFLSDAFKEARDVEAVDITITDEEVSYTVGDSAIYAMIALQAAESATAATTDYGSITE